MGATVATRRGGRGERRERRAAPDIAMLPALKRGLPLVEPLSEAQVARIDDASMGILEDVGVVFRDPVALEDWRRAGADVRGERVHLDRAMVRALIASIPSEITLVARDPAKSVPLGGDRAIFVPMTGAPYLRDLEDVRRGPTLDDLAMFHKLAHVSPALHSSAHHIVEPMDHPVSHRHLRITYSSMKHSDKTFMGMTTSGRNAEDVLEMCALLFGADFMEENAVVVGPAREDQLPRTVERGHVVVILDPDRCPDGLALHPRDMAGIVLVDEGLGIHEDDDRSPRPRIVDQAGHRLGTEMADAEAADRDHRIVVADRGRGRLLGVLLEERPVDPPRARFREHAARDVDTVDPREAMALQRGPHEPRAATDIDDRRPAVGDRVRQRIDGDGVRAVAVVSEEIGFVLVRPGVVVLRGIDRDSLARDSGEPSGWLRHGFRPPPARSLADWISSRAQLGRLLRGCPPRSRRTPWPGRVAPLFSGCRIRCIARRISP
ncbi:MAG: trimethylamine methyltransferase family protein [Pseudomonadota bacterium]